MDIRDARLEDLSGIIRLYAEDPLGARWERVDEPVPREYSAAFETINQDDGNTILVGWENGEIAACLQLTIIPGVMMIGAIRAQIEGLRVHPDYRGQGLGKALVAAAIHRARQYGCSVIQVLVDRARSETHGLYQSLGLADTHYGMRLIMREE